MAILSSAKKILASFSSTMASLSKREIFETFHPTVNESTATMSDNITQFNVTRLPEIGHGVLPHHGYVFFSRPSLNVYVSEFAKSIASDNAKENYEAMLSAPRSAAFVRDYHGRLLLHMLSHYSKSCWLPLLTLRANSYSVNDVTSIGALEVGKTFYGHSIPYAEANGEYKHSNTVTIEFTNDRYYSVLWCCYIWMCYMYSVSFDDSIKPRMNYQKNGILDYPGSIYYLAVAPDDREILYWEKLVGVYPVSAPFSIFSWEGGQPKLENKISIEFRYGIRSEPRDPAVLFMINTLATPTFAGAVSLMKNGTGKIIPYSKTLDGITETYSSSPVIHSKVVQGEQKYFLEWL